MGFKIVRNDITKMKTEAIVNTANERPLVGQGCDIAVYNAAGFDELLAYRKERIGRVPEGEVFFTPGFRLEAKYIIHAVSPLYRGGLWGEERLLRSCYRKSLELAKKLGIRSIAFPLISTGSFGYPREEGLRIAVDEISAFLMKNDMKIFLVVFDAHSTDLGRRIRPDLEQYIDQNYVKLTQEEEYQWDLYERISARRRDDRDPGSVTLGSPAAAPAPDLSGDMDLMDGDGYSDMEETEADGATYASLLSSAPEESCKPRPVASSEPHQGPDLPDMIPTTPSKPYLGPDFSFLDFDGIYGRGLQERMKHLSDTFSEYLLYLIRQKNMKNADVYKRAIVDKKIFSKIKNNKDYHPQKLTALCLCVGAKLNLDETKDLLGRAGYALSPCDKTDIIFSFFIENEIYDMIELDIQLEEFGLPCIIE